MVIEREAVRPRSTKNSNSGRSTTSTPDGGIRDAWVTAPIEETIHDAMKNVLPATVQKQLVQAIAKAVETVFADHVQILKETIQRQADTINDLEQYMRCESVRVYGIPEAPSGQKEDTDALVRDVFKTHLKVEVSPSEISRSHRTGVTIKGKSGEVLPRPVIAKFTTYKARHRVYKEKKKLKGSPICIKGPYIAKC